MNLQTPDLFVMDMFYREHQMLHLYRAASFVLARVNISNLTYSQWKQDADAPLDRALRLQKCLGIRGSTLKKAQIWGAPGFYSEEKTKCVEGKGHLEMFHD